jgi:hypothetical protein
LHISTPLACLPWQAVNRQMQKQKPILKNEGVFVGISIISTPTLVALNIPKTEIYDNLWSIFCARLKA